MKTLRIDIWSDVACPWCYVGKRRFEAARARFAHPVDIVWRSFELDPSAPPHRDESVPYTARLATKYRTTPEQAQAMIDRLVGIAAEDGLEMRFDRIRPGNTFDAHRLIHQAREGGLQDAMKERLLRAYFTEGAPIGNRATLARLAAEVGIDDAPAVLESDRQAREVRADEELARELGISGVPFFVIGGKLGLSGAQPVDVLAGALERMWSEVGDSGVVAGAVCGPDGCSV